MCNLVILVTHGPAAKQLDDTMPNTNNRAEASLDSHTQSAEDEYNVDTDYPQVFDYEILVVCFTYCRHVFFSFLHKFFFFFPAM